LKYISIIDSLDIDLDAITNLNEQKIIRLQKQLKANAILNNENNIGDLSALINQLRDDDLRQHHIFIENHQWLKKLLQGSFESITYKDITINKEEGSEFDSLKIFLEPFLLTQLKPFFKITLEEEKYYLFNNIVSQQDIYSETILQLISNYIRSRFVYATAYINEEHYKTKTSPVKYILHYQFINSVNQYSNSLEDEIKELNTAVIDVYNQYRHKISNPYLQFSAKAMVAFGKLKMDNVFLQDLLAENAAIARQVVYIEKEEKDYIKHEEEVYVEDEEEEVSKGKDVEDSNTSWKAIIWIIVILLKVVFVVSKCSNNSPSNYEPESIEHQQFIEQFKPLKKTPPEIVPANEVNDRYRELIEKQKNNSTEVIVEDKAIEKKEVSSTNKSVDEIQEGSDGFANLKSYSKRLKSENHIRFLYQLKRKTEKRVNDSLSKTVKIRPFTNPYTKTFNETTPYAKNLKKQYTLVRNKSKQDLIIFKLIKGIDEAIYIPKNKRVYLDIKVGDSLVFYTGKEFAVTRFSHFKREVNISKMYVVTQNDLAKNSEIRINPFYDKVYGKTSIITGDKSNGVIRLSDIKFTNLSFKKKDINVLYTRYYKEQREKRKRK